MEIFDKKEKEQKPKPAPAMSTCPQCGKQYPSRSNKKFCSNNCRSKASMTRSIIGSMGAQTAAQAVPMSSLNMGLNGLNPQSQYIIHHQEKEISRWESKYNDSEKKREKIEEENKRLRDELAQVKVDQKLSENAKPSGLSGFMESSLMQHLAPHIGPALGDVMKRFLLPITSDSGMQGMNELVQWLSAQPEEFQQQFYVMTQELSKIETPELMTATVTKMINFLTNGIAATTQQQQQQYSGSASAAFN